MGSRMKSATDTQVSVVWFSSSCILKQAPLTPPVRECPLEIAGAEFSGSMGCCVHSDTETAWPLKAQGLPNDGVADASVIERSLNTVDLHSVLWLNTRCVDPDGGLELLLLYRTARTGESVPGLQTPLVHPPFVPRLAGVLPPLLLHVWKGQQGQHGEGKEGRLCPARPPGCPEGKGAWRAVEQRKRVSRKKRHFPSSFFL
ncbi:hypothetical protein PAMA_005723 [Pampus argenteus]